MRILICNWKDREHERAGGAEVWTHGVGAAWAAEGHEVTLASAAVAGRPRETELDGMRVVRGGGHRVGVQRHARRVYDRAGGRFDLVIDEVNTRPFGAPAWARRSRVVAVAHQVAREVWFHEMPFPAAVVGRYIAEPWWLRLYADTPTVTVSASSATSLARYGLRRVAVVPQGSDLPESRRAAKAAVPTFVFLGRLSSAKRPLHAVRAFAAVRRVVPDARLVVLGDGPERPAVERAAGPGVEVLGRVSRAERDRVVGSAHALVVTSVREGWGLVVSEAAALGTPSIAYRVPGLVDSVTACDGYLCEPNPQALAAAMVELLPLLRSAEPPASHGTVPWSEVAERVMALADRERDCA